MERVKKYSAVIQEHWPMAKSVLKSIGTFLEALVATPKRIVLTGVLLAWLFALGGLSELMWSMLVIVAVTVWLMMLTSAGSKSSKRKKSK
jgi:hypothetical protein